MSELKEHLFVPYSELQEGDELTDAITIAKSYYLKSEADKVIAELKDKVLSYKVLYQEKCRDINTQERFFALERVHQKYKRCQAMARWCRSRACFYDTMREDGPYWCVKSDRAYKWYKWWFKTAFQFKEAK